MNSAFSDKKLDDLERLLTTKRLSKYTESAAGDREKALRLYEQNTVFSEAFYTPLQGLEICLRNAISLELTSHFGDDWHENGHGLIQYPLTEMIEKAKATLRRGGKAIENGRVVAELNFGFWVGLIGPRYESPLWRKHLHSAFPHGPGAHNRKKIQGALNSVRRLRNRVAHHEPIMHRNLRGDHGLIITIVAWMCPETARWIESQSRVISLISN